MVKTDSISLDQIDAEAISPKDWFNEALTKYGKGESAIATRNAH